ncbi:MAG: hypothetical protein JO246_00125 [Frankiaceae bacterium]|nr:hypothetical protein [Frankiaceae bacterium]MBV9872899.1 hypothetical protein [Frankiaceae bacterium]
MLRDIFLVVHISAGCLGLLVLPVIIVGEKGTARHVRLGRTFLWCLRVVAASAAMLAVINFRELWWFLLIAAFSLALGEVGSRGWRRRTFDTAASQHISGMGGAGIAFVTAVMVVNFGKVNPIAWVAPTIIGSPIIAVTIARIQRRGTLAAGVNSAATGTPGSIEASAPL